MRFYKAFFAAALLVGCIYAAPSQADSSAKSGNLGTQGVNLAAQSPANLANGGNSGTQSPVNSANSANFGTQSANSATQGVNSGIKSTNFGSQNPVNSANFADSTATGGGDLDISTNLALNSTLSTTNPTTQNPANLTNLAAQNPANLVNPTTQNPTNLKPNSRLKSKNFTLLAQNDAISENSSEYFPSEIPAKAYELGAVEITALGEVDANPSVIRVDSKNIKDKHAQNVAQAIRLVPGVMINEPTGRRGEPSVNIRGYGYTQIGLYLDGIPVMSIYDRQTDFGQFITQGISNIQISKGFTSPVYGMTSLGGAINLVSQKPEKELEFNANGYYLTGDEVRGGFSVGTNQGLYYLQAQLFYTDRDTQPLSKHYTGTTAQPSGDRINAFYKNKTVKLKAGWTPNDNHEYSLNYIYQNGEKGGAISSSGGNWWEWPYYKKQTIYLLGNSYFNDIVSLNTRLYYDSFYNELNTYGSATNGIKPNKTLTASDISLYDDDTIGGIFTLGFDFTKNTNLQLGINLKKDHHYETDGAGVMGANLDELSTSAFAQFAQRIWDFRLVLAGSFDKLDTFKADIPKGSNVQELEKTKIKSSFSLQGALYYDINDEQSVHLAAGRKENLPTLKDRYSSKWGNYAKNPDLKPESAIFYEIGYDMKAENTTITAAAFYNDMRDMFDTQFVYENLCSNYATADGNKKPANACYQNINVDIGYSYGAEFGIQQAFLDNQKLILGFSYSYIQKKAQGDADNFDGRRRITDYPNHILGASVKVRPVEYLEFIAYGDFESARWFEGTSGYYRDKDYFSMDASINYKPVKNITLSAGVLNLTDRDNWTSGQGANTAYHYAGRRYVLGFEFDY